MACDRFIYFKNRPLPSKEDLGKVLEDYLGAAAISVEWKEDRFVATLVGAGSFPFSRVTDRARSPEREERWFEVHLGGDNVDVITRQQDEFTSVVATGFAELVARFWRSSVTD